MAKKPKQTLEQRIRQLGYVKPEEVATPAYLELRYFGYKVIAIGLLIWSIVAFN